MADERKHNFMDYKAIYHGRILNGKEDPNCHLQNPVRDLMVGIGSHVRGWEENWSQCPIEYGGQRCDCEGVGFELYATGITEVLGKAQSDS